MLPSRARVPHVYCFSELLVPRPKDWGPHIGISGFLELDQTSNYSPPRALVEFLEAGEKPIYVGFGSIVVSNPVLLTRIVLEAIQVLGVRAIICRGWGSLMGGCRAVRPARQPSLMEMRESDETDIDIPDNVFVLDSCPHDWLFPRCVMACHHGGAGTTVASLRAGLPTSVVYFFAG